MDPGSHGRECAPLGADNPAFTHDDDWPLWGEAAKYLWRDGARVGRGVGIGHDGYNNGYLSGWRPLQGPGARPVPHGLFFEDDADGTHAWL